MYNYIVDPFGVPLWYEPSKNGLIKIREDYVLSQLTCVELPLLNKKMIVNKRIVNSLCSSLRELENSPYARFVKTITVWTSNLQRASGNRVELNKVFNLDKDNQHPKVVKVFLKYGFKRINNYLFEYI